MKLIWKKVEALSPFCFMTEIGMKSAYSSQQKEVTSKTGGCRLFWIFLDMDSWNSWQLILKPVSSIQTPSSTRPFPQKIKDSLLLFEHISIPGNIYILHQLVLQENSSSSQSRIYIPSVHVQQISLTKPKSPPKLSIKYSKPQHQQFKQIRIYNLYSK